MQIRQKTNNSKLIKSALFYILLGATVSSFAASNIPLNSKAGSKILVSSLNNNYANQFLAETKYFTYQVNTSFCAIATSTIVLNTLSINPPDDKNFGKYKLFTQYNIFTNELTTKTGISESSILGHGLTLAQTTDLLNSFSGVAATMYSTESYNEASSKKIIIKALKSDKQLVMVNILRSDMQETGGGHFSPVAAYDPKSDNFLFMDVATFKEYGPTWVPSHTLYDGMHTKDGNAYRGFIIVQKSSR